MALKTFNLDEEIYRQFSQHCKEQGISMSKKIENFIKQEIAKIKPLKKTKLTTLKNHPLSKYC
jgi:flagella basal body P-ring formation protein FlgA